MARRRQCQLRAYAMSARLLRPHNSLPDVLEAPVRRALCPDDLDLMSLDVALRIFRIMALVLVLVKLQNYVRGMDCAC